MSFYPMHAFVCELLSNSITSNDDGIEFMDSPGIVLIVDNAKGHGGIPAQDELVPLTALRRASSTGSLGINLKNGKGKSRRRKASRQAGNRWDTGATGLEAQVKPPKVLVEPNENDIEGIKWVIATTVAARKTCPLTRSGSTVSLDEGLDESDASNRWTTGSNNSGTPATKKDGAAKLPTRKFSSPLEFKIPSPSSSSVRSRSRSPLPVKVSVLDPSTTSKHTFQNILTALEEVDKDVNFYLSSSHMEIAPELFRTA